MKNWLKHFRINTANDFNPYQIHASGHASGPEIQEMIDAIKPGTLIPVHTEKPDLFSNTAGVVVRPVEGEKIPIS
jgi:ribonuclease J